MCICLFSTAHPDYPLILLSNRDEFISRPTLRADWWDPPHQSVLGGRDNQRKERGTWLGITKRGRLAVLTNFREEGIEVNHEKSRGKIVNAWLTEQGRDDDSEENFVHRLIHDQGIDDVGGFTLLFGHLRAPSTSSSLSEHNNTAHSDRPGLALISNRTSSATPLQRIGNTGHETHGLSNSHFGDTTWPKVVSGEALLARTINTHVHSPQDALISALFDVLSTDTLRRRRVGEAWEVYTGNMRQSIFIPAAKGRVVTASSAQDLAVAAGGDGASGTAQVHEHGAQGAYGTRNQTVVLVDRAGKVTFVERTLFDEAGRALSDEESERRVEFEIDGWRDRANGNKTESPPAVVPSKL